MTKEVTNNQTAEELAAQTAIVTSTSTAVVAPIAGGAYITGLLTELKNDFIAANEGLDMDFVYMGTWLVIDKKGNFVEKDDPTISYGDKIDIVIGQGEKRWSLWGLEKSPEEGQLIVACKEKEDAVAELTAWLEENQDAKARYSINDLQLRYMAYVVPVNTLGKDTFPKIYLMSFAPTVTITYGKWARNVYEGKYKDKLIAPRTGVNRIVTRLTTSEKKGSGTNTFIGIEFDAVGMFDPKEYGIGQENAAQ